MFHNTPSLTEIAIHNLWNQITAIERRISIQRLFHENLTIRDSRLDPFNPLQTVNGRHHHQLIASA